MARPRRRMPAMRPARLQSTAPSRARRQGSPKAFIAAADWCCALDRMHVPCHRVSAPRSRARHAPTGPGTARPPGTPSNCACVPIRLPSSAHPCRARRGPRDPRRARSPNKHPENCMKAASIAIAVATLSCAATVGAQEIILYENDNFNGQRYSAQPLRQRPGQRRLQRSRVVGDDPRRFVAAVRGCLLPRPVRHAGARRVPVARRDGTERPRVVAPGNRLEQWRRRQQQRLGWRR